MTLNTYVLLLDPHPIAEVHDFVNRELLGHPDARHDDSGFWPERYPARRYFTNESGQGLAAWFIGYAGGDGPVQATSYTWDEETDEETETVIAEGSMMLSFDTGYGYSTAGASCSDLHAYFIARLSYEYGDLWFQNEFTGDWHHVEHGGENVALGEFGSTVRGARAAAAERAAA